MEKALIIIDYTNDFVAEDGQLTCGAPAQAIENNIVSLAKTFQKENQSVILATDVHYEGDTYHPEHKLFPPHNIYNTRGRDFYGALKSLVENNGTFYQMDKTRYSAFAGTNLDIKLRERNVKEVHLCGVCTDICVLHTAIDAYNLGYSIVVHEKAVASFDEVGHQYALKHFTNVLGAQVIN